MHTTIDPDNILIIPPTPPAAPNLNTHAPVLEDVFVMPSMDFDSPANEELNVLQIEDTAATPAQVSSEEFVNSAEIQTRFSEFQNLQQEKVSEPRRAPQKKSVPASRDKYSMGVQMLRVSPVWLLIGGLAFVSLIVAGKWFLRPSAQAQNIAATRAERNQATNRSVAPSKTNPPAATNRAKQQDAGAAKVSAPAQASEVQKPSVEVKERPFVEKQAEAVAAPKKSEAAVALKQAGNQGTGKFTLQIGSYNDVAEANNRASSLKAAGLEGRVVAAEIPKRGTWYRVQVGRFQDRGEATRFGAQLRAQGIAESALVAEVQP
ncbi:MAG TPA: SPOR domain-containing protein [Pyrinomonadaceae bacterium]|jgi:cell division septation protein DedD|nr:SPOR domain-containing protein [Pyrinomonadaceae bacterium]